MNKGESPLGALLSSSLRGHLLLPSRTLTENHAQTLRLRAHADPLVEAAFLLATARRQRHRTARLPPIRSLHYFLPIIEEVLRTAPDPGYADYLRRATGITWEDIHPAEYPPHLDQQRGLFATTQDSKQDSNRPPARVQKKPFLRDR